MDAILAQTKAFVDDLEAKIVQRDNIIAGQDVLITEKNMYIAELKYKIVPPPAAAPPDCG